MSLKIIEKSPAVTITHHESNDDINLFSQFFIPPNKDRLTEIQTALVKNVNNIHINRIYLLNERIYTPFELGIESEKIIQININKRLKFSNFFTFIKEQRIYGFNVLINIDIFFDNSIINIKKSDIKANRKVFALLRHEYRGEDNLNKCPLYGSTKYYLNEIKKGELQKRNHYKIPKIEGNPTSNDTWIIHSNNNLSDKEISLFNFELGKQGCDNKIIYLFKILGFEIYNTPEFIKSYHFHKQFSKLHKYNIKGVTEHPWGIYFTDNTDLSAVNLTAFEISITDFIKDTNCLSYHNFTNDNITLMNYISNNINNKFIIPRIAGIENVFAYLGACLLNRSAKWDYLKYNAGLKIMKKHAGIKLTNDKSIIKFSQTYCRAFRDSELYASWESYGDVRKGIKISHDFITKTFDKQQIWAYTFDIFHYINNPWTLSLAGKRLLIISPFIESIKEKISIREKIYGKDLFPNCEFVFIKPPQTQGDEPSEEFDIEFNKFCKDIFIIKDDFDIALVSCGGYGNPICAFIYNHINKSAIYVGGVLQMYFGIYGERWLRERKDIMRLYLNEYWTRPKETEKPTGYKDIEGNCYW